jgi:hypothetical protein
VAEYQISFIYVTSPKIKQKDGEEMRRQVEWSRLPNDINLLAADKVKVFL